MLVSYQKVQVPTIDTRMLTTLDSKDNRKIVLYVFSPAPSSTPSPGGLLFMLFGQTFIIKLFLNLSYRKFVEGGGVK